MTLRWPLLALLLASPAHAQCVPEWTTVPTASLFLPRAQLDMGDRLVVGSNGDPMTCVFTWDDHSWSGYASGFIGKGVHIDDLEAFNGTLYAFTSEFAFNAVTARVYTRAATKWNLVHSFGSGGMRSACVYQNALHVGGYLEFGVGAQIQRFDGTAWNAVAGAPTGQVNALAVHQGHLVAAGRFDAAGGLPVNNIAAWNGGSWSPLGDGLDVDSLYGVRALQSFRDDLIATGVIVSASGVPMNNIARWDGESWKPLGTGLSAWSGQVIGNTLTVYQGDLCVGGSFTSAGGLAVSNLARWREDHWNTLGDASIEPVSSLGVFDRALYAGTSTKLHRWGCPCAADCDGSGSLDVNDFACYQTLFAIGDLRADCDDSGTLDVDDLICFQTIFVLGC
jgi:hypothetical protein